jgi:hypothetical protein
MSVLLKLVCAQMGMIVWQNSVEGGGAKSFNNIG